MLAGGIRRDGVDDLQGNRISINQLARTGRPVREMTRSSWRPATFERIANPVDGMPSGSSVTSPIAYRRSGNDALPRTVTTRSNRPSSRGTVSIDTRSSRTRIVRSGHSAASGPVSAEPYSVDGRHSKRALDRPDHVGERGLPGHEHVAQAGDLRPHVLGGTRQEVRAAAESVNGGRAKRLGPLETPHDRIRRRIVSSELETRHSVGGVAPPHLRVAMPSPAPFDVRRLLAKHRHLRPRRPSGHMPASWSGTLGVQLAAPFAQDLRREHGHGVPELRHTRETVRQALSRRELSVVGHVARGVAPHGIESVELKHLEFRPRPRLASCRRPQLTCGSPCGTWVVRCITQVIGLLANILTSDRTREAPQARLDRLYFHTFAPVRQPEGQGDSRCPCSAERSSRS